MEAEENNSSDLQGSAGGRGTNTAQPRGVSCQAAKRDRAALEVLDTGTVPTPKPYPCALLWLQSTSCNLLQVLEN